MDDVIVRGNIIIAAKLNGIWKVIKDETRKELSNTKKKNYSRRIQGKHEEEC